MRYDYELHWSYYKKTRRWGGGEGLTHPPLKIIILNQFYLILLINYTKKEKKGNYIFR